MGTYHNYAPKYRSTQRSKQIVIQIGTLWYAYAYSHTLGYNIVAHWYKWQSLIRIFFSLWLRKPVDYTLL